MKNTALLALMPVLILAAFSAYFLSRRPKVVPVETPAAILNTAKSAMPAPGAAAETRWNPLFQSARAPIAAPEGTSRECSALWDSLRALNLGDLVHPSTSVSVPPASTCTQVPEALAALHTHYAEQCGQLGPHPDLPSEEWVAQAERCQRAIFIYRAGLTDWLVHDQPVTGISDPRVLLDRTLARLGGDSAGSAEAAERLLEISPSAVPVIRLLLVGRFLDAEVKAAGKPEDPRWKKFDEAVQKARHIGAEDARGLVEAEALETMVRYQNTERLRVMAQRINLEHPSFPTGPYFMAWADFRAGNKAGALQYLSEAQRRDPSDGRTAETLLKLNNGNPSPFPTSLRVDIDPGPYLR